MCIHPMKPEDRPENLMNISNGTIAVPQVNVDKAVYIGKNQLVEFEKLLPTGYWKPIERKVKTMAVAKRNCCWV